MFRRLMGLEPLNITERDRCKLVCWLMSLMMVDVLVPVANRAVGLPFAIAITLQVLTIIGILWALVWALRRANRPRRLGDRGR
jgi:hypothetical protein